MQKLLRNLSLIRGESHCDKTEDKYKMSGDEIQHKVYQDWTMEINTGHIKKVRFS